MKPKINTRSFRFQPIITVCGSLRTVGIAALLASTTTQLAFATSDVWDGSTSDLWTLDTNWLTNPAAVPGTGDTATFSLDSATVNSNTSISLNGITVKTIVFDTASAAAYTLGTGAVSSQAFTLNYDGAITMNAAVANDELFNAQINLGAAAGSYTFTNNSAKTLTFAGKVQGGTGGVNTLNLGGTGNMSFATIFKGTLAKTGAGTVTLGGTADNDSAILTLTEGTVVLNKVSSNGVHALGKDSTINAGTLRIEGSGGDQIFNNANLTVNGGVFDLNGQNETINALIAASSGGIVLNGANATTRALNVGGNNGSGSFAGLIADNAGGGATGIVAFSKNGTGTQTLAGANTYSGNTAINGGTLVLGANSALGNTSVVQLGNNTSAGNLDMGAFNQTIKSLNFKSKTTLVTNNVTIGSGNTLTISSTANGVSSLYLGETNADGSNTNVVIKGATPGVGSLVVTNTLGNNNNFSITNTNTGTTTGVVSLDMSQLGSFTGTFSNWFQGTGAARISTEVTLADMNTITTNVMRIGGSNGTETVLGNFLKLGQSNTINATTISIGNARSSADVLFRTGLSGTPTLTIRATDGIGRAELTLGNNSASFGGVTGGATSNIGTMDLTAGSADLLLNNLRLGVANGVTSTDVSHPIGILTFDEGTVDATTVTIGGIVRSADAIDVSTMLDPRRRFAFSCVGFFGDFLDRRRMSAAGR